MASSRPSQGQNSTKRLVKRTVTPDRVRTNAAPRTSNNKRKRAFG